MIAIIFAQVNVPNSTLLNDNKSDKPVSFLNNLFLKFISTCISFAGVYKNILHIIIIIDQYYKLYSHHCHIVQLKTVKIGFTNVSLFK